MVEAIGQGILTGLVLATFLGPIFFTVVDLGLKGNVKGAAFIALGTFLSDILNVCFIYFVAQNIDQHSLLFEVMYIVGGLILVVFGLQSLLKTKIIEQHVDLKQENDWALFSKGFLINSLNPNVFFFWFGAVMVAVKTYNHQSELILVHFFSALLIVLNTDFLKGYVASLLRHRVDPKILLYISKLSGFVLIYFGLRLIFYH